MTHFKAPIEMMALAAVGLSLAMAGVSRADTRDTRPTDVYTDYSTAPTTPGTGTSGGVYDLGPAYGRAAFFDQEFSRTYDDLQSIVTRLHQQFESSDDYLAAKKKVADAQAAYEALREPVVQRVSNDANYRDLMEKRTKMEIALRQKNLPQEDVIALATRKMEYGAAARQIEADAINSDAAVQQAKAILLAAQSDLNAKTAKMEAGVYDNPLYVTAKHAFDLARSNRAAAYGYLAGASLARSDTVDADVRRYDNNNGVSNFSYPYYDPYYRGYYGFGTMDRY